MKISDIDSNFSLRTISGTPVVFRNVTEAPFALEGLPFKDSICDGAPYCRVSDQDTAAIIAENPACMGVMGLRKCTAGAAVRFRASTPYMAIRAKTRESYDMNHMPRSGSCGFDLYRKCPGETTWRFISGVRPNPIDDKFSVCIEEMLDHSYGDWCNEECDYLLNLPLYGGVAQLELGFAPEAILAPPTPHAIPKPICFYGSSITQGGCASHPGNTYCHHLCRAVDAEQINLGFSGNGRAGNAVAVMLNRLDLACLVLDYDHNAPDEAYLLKTHEALFQAIREKNPDLPIIIVSKPDVGHQHSIGTTTGSNAARRDIIKATYDHAKAQGDTRVWFVDGFSLFGTMDDDACTVDGCHPNDLGFYRMYQTILPVLKEALSIGHNDR